MPTYTSIEQAIVAILAQKDEGVSRVPVPSRTTAAGTTTTLTDAVLTRGMTNTARYDGRLVKIIEDVASAYATAATVDGAHADATATTLAVSDATSIEVGDVIEVNALEHMLVTNVVANNATVVRGYQGTTAAAYTGGQSVNFAYQGAIVGIDSGGLSTAGVLTVSPAFTSTPPIGLQYLMYPEGLTPEMVRRALNRVMLGTDAPSLFPLSIHICTSDDNDMETAPATSFDANKSNATLANETTIVHNGGQSLAVTASAAGGYTHFGTVGVNEYESLYAAVNCYVTSGDSATFRIYRVTATAATIEDATTDEVKWMELMFPFTVPADCEQIYAQAISDANGDVTYWDDYQLWRSGRGVYPLPSWIKRKSQIIDVRAFPRGTGGPSSDNDYRTNERLSHGLDYEFAREDARADNPLHLGVTASSARPYIVAMRPLAELSYDTESTPCDKEYAVSKAVSLLLKDRGDSAWKGYARDAAARADVLHYGERGFSTTYPETTV